MVSRYQVDPQNGILLGGEFIASPNFTARPHGVEIDLLVIHNISLPAGKFITQNIIDLFLNQLDLSKHPSFATLKDLKVSSHLLLTREGVAIQFVPFNLCAHHAGVSSYKGRSSCNHFSIGIELEGADEIPYTESQYSCLALITAKLMQCYPGITIDRIVGHQNIAPERKTDPGPAFDWQKFINLVEKEIKHETDHLSDLHHPSSIS